MKAKFTYAGSNPTKANLEVFFHVAVGGSTRLRTLRIPWSELSDRKILNEIDAQVRKELMAAWDGPRLVGLDLPGID
uniref:Uncharacterized protein n=1 Tax=uncultured prokaryote TaxID=198431 RepID=A0A0H5Q5S9_9ZZZZ|nr:hypothetical protein [uncultured prokaryote]